MVTVLESMKHGNFDAFLASQRRHAAAIIRAYNARAGRNTAGLIAAHARAAAWSDARVSLWLRGSVRSTGR